MKSINTLANELRVSLKARNFNITDSADDMILLQTEVQRAIDKINECRRFTPTEDKPYPQRYESTIIPLCLCAFAKIGAEGQTSHSENGVTRNYTTGGDYPQDMLNGIIPLVK